MLPVCAATNGNGDDRRRDVMLGYTKWSAAVPERADLSALESRLLESGATQCIRWHLNNRSHVEDGDLTTGSFSRDIQIARAGHHSVGCVLASTRTSWLTAS